MIGLAIEDLGNLAAALERACRTIAAMDVEIEQMNEEIKRLQIDLAAAQKQTKGV